MPRLYTDFIVEANRHHLRSALSQSGRHLSERSDPKLSAEPLLCLVQPQFSVPEDRAVL